jgi:ABC-2 type transport system ATP-binding protein
MTQVEPVVAARGLTKRYGDKVAVDRLDLEVRPGEVFGLLGPNGAGKTTTILMLLGLAEPTAGSARVVGLDPTREPLTVKRRVGYLPDQVGFDEHLTGRQNLRYTARLNRIADDEADQRISDLLSRVGPASVADRAFGTYSRGMRQRLGIAEVLVKDPQVAILDEPTVAIDPEGVAEILTLIRSLADDGMAVLLSSHLLQQVQSVCDRVGIFVDGRLVASGAVQELAERYARGAVTVEVGMDGDAEALLRALPGVHAVEADPREPGRWLVTADGDPRAAITGAAASAGLAITYLRRRGDALDELYHRWFEEAHDDAA